MRVYCEIVGDLFHYGHVNFLKKAKEVGDFVIVGLMSGNDVESYKRRPILNIDERRIVVESCKYVDLVIPNCTYPITKEFMDEHNIDLVLHGDDFSDEDVERDYSIPKKLNKFKFLPHTKGISTSNIIKRILDKEKIK